MIYAATREEIEARRKAFIRKWRLKHRAVADSLEEARDCLFTFARLPPSQWKSTRTTNAIERLHEEFKRRIKTQTVRGAHGSRSGPGSRTLRTNQGGLSGCGNPAPASGARVQAVPYPGQANAGPDNAYRPPMPMAQAQQQAVISALPPEDQPETGPVKSMPPQFRRTIVDYWSKEPGGTIIIDTPHTYLYLVLGKGKAMRYGIGVGREGFTWSGAEKVTRMAEWPDWHPPEEMIERQPYLPRFMAGGEGNPLGARALYLGQTLYRIHGTNQPSTIGTFVSSGCIRLTNEDITDLYSRVQVGTRVVVLPGKEPSATPTRQRSKAVTAEKPAAKPTSSGLPQVSSPQASPSPAAPAQASTVKNEAVSDETVTSAPPAEQWAE